MADYDIKAAREAGISDAEIAGVLAPKLNYDLEGARKAGIPDSDIADALASKFSSTPGGAAVGNPTLQNKDLPQRQREKINLPKIGGAGIAGAGFGAFSAPILETTGAAVSALPGAGPAIGAALQSAGRIARVAGPVAGAISGGLSGLAEETAGQVAESAGQSGPVTAIARGVGGLVGGVVPEFKALAGFAIRKTLGVTGIADLAASLKKVAQGMGMREEDLTPNQKKYIEEQIAQLRGGSPDTQPMKDVYGGLKAASDDAIRASRDESSLILSNAEKAAANETGAAIKGTIDQRKKGLVNLPEIARNAEETARSQRFNIGNDTDMSTIGDSLRTPIIARLEDAKKARDIAYKRTESIRDSEVAKKEMAGQFVEAQPEFKTLVKDLEGQLQDTVASRLASPTQKIADQGIRRDLSGILESIRTKRVAVSESEAQQSIEKGYKIVNGTNPLTGEPQKYREFPNSFSALDDIRRKLGDVFKGQPGEGYASIGESNARKYYKMISDIQKNFVDGETEGIQSQLLKQYAEDTKGMAPLLSKFGKKATLKDKIADEISTTNSGDLPKFYFKDRDGIQALMELTGDKKIVQNALKDYAATSVKDMDAKQVRSWMTKNREVLREFGSIQSSLDDYATALERSERIQKNVKKAVDIVSLGIQDVEKQAKSAADRIIDLGWKQADEAIKRGGEQSKLLLGEVSDIKRVRDIVNSGKVDQWNAIIPAIQNSPEARQAIVPAIRQVLADRPAGSAKETKRFFDEELRRFLEPAGLITKAEADKISQQIANIGKMDITEGEKNAALKRIMSRTLSGSLGSAASNVRDAAGGYEKESPRRSLVERIPQ